MKIDTKPLEIKKKTVEATGSWGEVDQADELMITLYSIDTASDMVEGLKAERKLMKDAMAFFENVLGLDDKQAKHVFDTVPSSTMNIYISYVCGLIKGAPYQEFAEFNKQVHEENTDSKKESTPEK
ncbi:phage tail tube assembly chaperone [Limosilactobacillus vaginalis]|uniref:phage tail tube assembly chaperone n=1 Tax=Limosilactobacillus vaginalis TaxID=1633 RepID=UPI003735CB3A